MPVDKRTGRRRTSKEAQSKAESGAAKTPRGQSSKSVGATSKKPKKAAARAAGAESAPKRTSKKKVRIVGIGASAGGLEPMELFFAEMPADSGLTFVVVQHLSPDFRSMMDELLARHTSMEICQVQSGMAVQPNTIYLCPPRSEVTVDGNTLCLHPVDEAQILSLPIDSFFESLATARGPDAIGVILSGTGSDGTKGGKAIRDAGGVVIVQDPETAKFDSMPRSALEKEVAALAAGIGDIPALIIRHLDGPPIQDMTDAERFIIEDPVRHILYLLRERYGPDFGYYKSTTVNRRIKRRGLLRHIQDEAEYARLVSVDKQELENLYCDLLIGVTRFFRDDEAFQAFSKFIVPEISRKMSPARQLRVWIPGCASGEEAYSIAILFAEYAREHDLPLNIKILATDIHLGSLEVARAGTYPSEQLSSVDPELLERYFDFAGGFFTVKADLRQRVVFSAHNLIKDPPFTRMDLISCRNLLIYLREIAQRKVLALFHFSLSKNGILFLGPSETTGELGSEFTPIDRKWRIFRKRRDVKLAEASRFLPDLTVVSPRDKKSAGRDKDRAIRPPEGPRSYPGMSDYVSTAKQKALQPAYNALLDKYAPPSMLVDINGDLLHVFGDVNRYLSVRQGVFSHKLVDLVSEQFRTALAPAVERVFRRGISTSIRTTGTPQSDGVTRSVTIHLDPLPDGATRPDYVLVTFQSRETVTQPSIDVAGDAADRVADGALQQQFAELERELRISEESLQSTIEELETSNEELQATNEELMASNEELQSTNEELHSVNEELYTISAEHQRKIEELMELNDDVNNLLRSSDVGTIFLNPELTIRRFTPATAKTFNLLDRDIGRPIEHVTYRFEGRNLLQDIKSVQKTNKNAEHEISVDGKDYLLRILPYWTEAEEAAGIVVTTIDVSELKQAQARLVQEQRRYKDVVEEQTELVCRFAADGGLSFVNPAFCQFFGKKPQKLHGTKFSSHLLKADRQKVETFIEALRPGKASMFEHELPDRDGRAVWLQWTVTAAGNGNAAGLDYQAVGRDVTALKRQRYALEKLHEITSDANTGTDDKIAQVLALGARHFELPLAELARVEGGTLIITHAYSPDGPVRQQQVIPLPQDGCPVGSGDKETAACSQCDSMGDGLQDPKPQMTICQEVIVGQACYGLIRFAQIEGGSPRHFNDDDRELLHLIAQWIGLQLSLDQSLANREAEVRRTKEIESLLEQKVAALAQSNAELEQFAYAASHDMQEPLRKIETAGSLLLEEYSNGLEPEAQELLEIAADGAHRMRNFIDDLLGFARIGTAEFEETETNLGAPLAEAIQDLQARIGESGAEIAFGELPTLPVAAPYMRQLFLNLIDNSIKYRGEAPLKIEIGAIRDEDVWTFSTTDNGIGIDAQCADRIFDLFQRLHGRSEYSGTGIGLAICRRIVERHGGRIWLDTGYDQGARFCFTLPAAIAGGAEAARGAAQHADYKEAS